MTDVTAYLQRLGLAGAPTPVAAWLQRLHLTHLTTVPFENLDIHGGVGIVLETVSLTEKIVARRRGGYCYEVNGAFAGLLGAIGFDVTLAQCRVHGDEGPSPPFDHLALLVHARDDPDGSVPWLVDVGFGDSFVVPHRLGTTWAEPGGAFRTRSDGGEWLLERDRGEGWEAAYALDPQPRTLDEFAPRNRWHETSPGSPFRRQAIATLATPAGRVTIAGDRLILTAADERSERELPDAGERRAVVGAWFGSAVADALEVALSR